MSFCASGFARGGGQRELWFKGGASVFQVPMGFSLALLGAGYLVDLTGGIAILLGISICLGCGRALSVGAYSATCRYGDDSFCNVFVEGKSRFIGAEF